MIYIDPNLPVDQRRQLLINYVQTMSALMQSPGWELMSNYFKDEEKQAFNYMHKAENGDAAMKAIGAYATLKKMRELPEQFLIAAKKELENIDS